MKKSIKFLLLTASAFILTLTAIYAQSPATELPSITSNIVGLHLSTVGFILLGFLGYFVARFRIMLGSNPTVKFSLGEWIKRNWLNCGYFVLALGLIHLWKIELDPQSAILIGGTPNLAIDWIQRELKAIGFSTGERG